jgi:hypothetical protein
VPSQHHVARVAVDEQTWQAFRHAALVRGLSVAAYLGKLVETEVKRRGVTALATTHEHDPPPDVALDALATARATLDELHDVAGRLARTAVCTGASWDEVGERLGFGPADARRAFEQR